MQYSIVYFSEAKKERRFDAEFYKNDYVNILNNILKHNNKFLYEIASNKYKKLPNNKKDIEWKYVEIDKIICFQNDYNYTTFFKGDTLPSRASKIPKLHDIIISTVRPTRGAICIFNDIEKDIIVSSGFSIVHTDKINNNYLYTVLSSSFYLKLYERLTKASMYPAMSEEDLFNLPIPIFSDKFQKSIEKLVLEAHNQRQKSNSLMKEANEILEKEIGFDKLEIKKKKVNYSIVNYRETLSSKRIDAEYYQEKYKIIMDKIQSYKNGSVLLNDLKVQYSTGFAFDSDSYSTEGLNLIRINNIKPCELDITNSVKVNSSFSITNQKDVVNYKDLLISMSGTIGNCCVIPKNINAIINQRVLKFNVSDFDENVLCVFINSLAGRAQIERIGTGGVQINISANDIFNIKIPLIDKNVQNIIAEKVQDSYKARDKAKALLEEAKKKVEDAIENGE
ncbi:restriction endonuclease subunit S [Brachyspira hyodysenteriae]|uniref:restriction endonuclease subunit S n=1 Tax=Brachyspira hyodysenteriae TaxID=159 RepID=UPI001ADD77EE|nr:restriction endonuclease subunit S [Brachyspira hyodysenteriae]QTM06810.1 hypothetical protein GQX61_11505 [Brachyspira hyodysenteriae]